MSYSKEILTDPIIAVITNADGNKVCVQPHHPEAEFVDGEAKWSNAEEATAWADSFIEELNAADAAVLAAEADATEASEE
jgi:hypothetical protein